MSNIVNIEMYRPVSVDTFSIPPAIISSTCNCSCGHITNDSGYIECAECGASFATEDLAMIDGMI